MHRRSTPERFTAEPWDEPCIHHGRLPAARRARHGEQPAGPGVIDELLDEAGAAEEQLGVRLFEGQQPTVGIAGRPVKDRGPGRGERVQPDHVDLLVTGDRLEHAHDLTAVPVPDRPAAEAGRGRHA